jgi:hypothetical protein
MLLLWLSTLGAQNNCDIFNLTATPVQVNPVNCQFFISLDFEHVGTTNQFSVSGNGNIYGLFQYGQLPLILGPFNGDPNAPTPLEFVVTDVVFQDCNAVIDLNVPPCNNGAICNISNLIVAPGSCDPSGATYELLVNFQTQGAVNGFFEVFAGGGVSLGIFPLAALPLQIPAFPASGNLKDVIKVCMDGQPNCCETLEFDPPACANGPCVIDGLTVQTGACSTDSTYELNLDFEVLPPITADSFALWSNGQFVGNFGLNQLPLTQTITWNGGAIDEIEVCVTNAAIVCCKTRPYPVPACINMPPCGIRNLAVKVDSCTSDSTFLAILDFGVNDSTAVDSFQLWANGNDWGLYGMDQLPLKIDSFPWNGLIFNQIRICTGNDPACCKEYRFLAPNCLPFGPCALADISVETDSCTSDSTYNITLNFNASNPGNGTFTVSIHNQLLDTFNLLDLPLSLEVPWNGQQGDFVTVCILGPDSLPPGANACCGIRQFLVPECLLPCDIFDVTLDPGACSPNGDSYSLFLDFEVTNPGNDFFEVWGNGTYLGLFALDSLPLTIPNFPSNGNDIDVIKICINDHPDCCETIEFQGPDCVVPCEIFDVVLDPGACNPNDSTYTLSLDFEVHNPSSDSFEVWANGSYLGVFALNALPLQIPNFPSNGNAIDVIKICIQGNADCCKTIEFQGPDCLLPCEIFNVTVDPGACNPNDDSYSLVLNFEVNNPGNALFEVWANGTYLGLFPLAGLPLTIPNFPTNGNAIDVIKICINDHPDCCETIEFQGPDCGAPCEIFDLNVQTGACNAADSTYEVTVNFQVQNPNSNLFSIWANGQFFGTYDLSQLPLLIPNFPWDGTGPQDVIKVCLTDNNGALSCCRTIEFPTPNCFGNCAVNDLHVDTGMCNNDSTYQLTINFNVNNPPGNTFSLWANGQFFGIFDINDLPLTIQQFTWDGGLKDEIKICFTNVPGGPGACCAELEFAVPACLFPAPCDIYDLTVTPGACNPNAPSYPLTIDFEVDHPGNDFFEVWVNGVYYGLHTLASLPYTIPNVPSNGNAVDEIKVCINDQPNCCQTLTFDGPDCNGGGGNCDIVDVVVDPGACNPATNTYNLALNFSVVNPSANFFDVWGNGIYLGNFPLAALPLNLPNFPDNGPGMDEVKICITGNLDCCATIQFQGPDCGGGGNCDIVDFVIETGACTGDSTYNVEINFQVVNPTSNLFRVWANGQVLGDFNLNQLPLLIPDFPWNGGNTDEIKVCLLSNIPNTPACCIERLIPVPNCVGGDCEIWDLQVLRTPCLCGQFFAILTFNHENGGAGGFDIVGNGNNYGNFPYDTIQPIILGPFDGDGTTMYEFAVIDHNHPNCGDDFNLGKVDCTSNLVSPTGGSAMLTLSPNPTANWLNVTALLENGAAIGQADVEIYAADGRLLKTNTVANGANFQLDVSNLPSGVYRLTLRTDSGRLEGSFVKE